MSQNLKQVNFPMLIPNQRFPFPQHVTCSLISVRSLQAMFFMGSKHLPTQCYHIGMCAYVLCARKGYRKHSKLKSSSSLTHFVHGLCPSNLLAMLIYN